METSRFAEKLKNREWTQMNANRKDSEIACLLLVLGLLRTIVNGTTFKRTGI
jgi:hypothetical protein